MNWLDKLINPLSNPKSPQIQNRLVKYDDCFNIIGKCAEGEIACQNNLVIAFVQRVLSHGDLMKLGVPRDLLTGLPSIVIQDKLNVSFLNEYGGIGSHIITLNDYGFKYREIAEFLKVTFGDAV